MAIGYVVASYNLQDLVANVPGFDHPLHTLAKGSVLPADTKLFASHEPPVDLPAPKDGKPLLLKVSYEQQDILASSPDNQGSILSFAFLEEVSFMDPEDDLKYGNLFDQARVDERRRQHRMESLLANEFARKYVVLRAMDREAGHLLPMDYAYISNGSVVKTMAKNVVAAYENGDSSRLFSSTEKALYKTLEHAVTMAVSSCKPQHVTVAVVDNKHLYKARNEGEFFYDADKPKKVDTLIEVDAEGIPSLAVAAKAKERLLVPKL